jgi:hypothetical protein
MLDSLIREQLDHLQQLMTEQPFVVLTGAGISTPSGIPDYRDNQGVRRGCGASPGWRHAAGCGV